jgi:hypothetical protein
MIDLDRYIPPGGLPKRRRGLEKVDAEERAMRRVWCVFAGATTAATILLGFVHRERVTVRSLRRLRKKFHLQPRQVLRLVQLPTAAGQARHQRPSRGGRRRVS